MNKTGLGYIKLKKTKMAFSSLSVYRHILKDDTVILLNKLISALYIKEYDVYEYTDLYNRFIFSLFSIHHRKSLKEHIVDLIILDSNTFSQNCEDENPENDNSPFFSAVKNDLNNLQIISDLSSTDVKSCIIECCSPSNYDSDAIDILPSWECKTAYSAKTNFLNANADFIKNYFLTSSCWSDGIKHLYEFHRQWGTGLFSKYKALVWEKSDHNGCLRGVERPDPILLSDLVDYESERSEIINNTEKFLAGFPANNVLLYGDRGTGKSSTVKAIVNEYYHKGLRIVEVPKNHLMDFPKIINILRKSSLKFIIFVDDLAFEDNEENYTALKAVLEGGVESKPQNVLIYATSNRRHIIKEKFSDRSGLYSNNHDDEVRAADTIQEKLSLADRFGITVVFSSPDKQKYLNIVEGIVKIRGIKVDKDYLHREALKWELWYNGRSPRTAKQFADWLEGNINSK